MEKEALTEIMETDWVARAIYTCEHRGIPSVVDGLKPVQRFLLHQGKKLCANNFDKVAAVGSSAAVAGYAHGEASAVQALTEMGKYHSNNLQLFDGDGNFGNKLAPDSAAAGRYIKVRLSKVTEKLFLDNDLLPAHPDPEVSIPQWNLPIIPMVLVNGINGIATGYAASIPPHCPTDLCEIMIGKTQGLPARDPKPKYPLFTGTIERDGEKYVLTGNYEVDQKKGCVEITELPYGISSKGYESILDSLEEKGTIKSYDNLSRKDRFHFKVSFRRGSPELVNKDRLMKTLKLQKSFSWNLSVVTEEGKLKVFPGPDGLKDIIDHFYNFRISFVSGRIRKKTSFFKKELAYLKGFFLFCLDVISEKFDFKSVGSDDEFCARLRDNYRIPDCYLQKVIMAPIKGFTKKAAEKLAARIAETEAELKYWEKVTPEEEFRKNLVDLKEALERAGAKL
jgi:DNA topoisomerase-2